MTVGDNKAREIFLGAVEQNPSDRAAFLERACGGDAALRQRVEALLRANDAPGAFLSEAGADPNVTAAQPAAPSARGTVIAGRYRLLEQIGDGGMGSVWMAEQREPVRRLVAVKLIKPGMDSRAVLARFEAERQALALMDHPNIAKVLDGGTTADGRPYFVMELVRGLPLTEYCDARRLPVSERLALFAEVCAAVQHAHQKGVIHRDLKPSNVLVTEHDGKPVPKVIDFGLAKALNATNVLTDRTLHTSFGTVVGTPLYMAPEQVGINALDVDTRTDVYSLGVILYELLAGSTPLEKARFKQAAWDEVKRLIREEEPPRPSTRLTGTANLPSLAASRGAEPAQLSRALRGELDWIVMKALEKDRGRRYETANGFAMDVRRYLAGDPVMAVPPSAAYRLRKLATRHRTALAVAAVVALLLAGGVAVSTFEAVRARHAERAALLARQAERERAEGERRAKIEADARRAEVEAQKTRAEAGEKRAEEEKRAAQAVRDFLTDKLLAQADPMSRAQAQMSAGEAWVDSAANPTVRDLLDRAAEEMAPEKIEGSFPGQPYVQAEILGTLGVAYSGVGESERAIGYLQRALALLQKCRGPEDPRTLTLMSNLAVAYSLGEKLDEAISTGERTLALMKAKLGTDEQNTLVCMFNLACIYWEAGRQRDSMPLMEEAVRRVREKLGPTHPQTLLCQCRIAYQYGKSGRLDLAVPLMEQTLKEQLLRDGPASPVTIASTTLLAELYQLDRKLPLAVALIARALDACRATRGPDHPQTLIYMADLATLYEKAGQVDKALQLMEQALRLDKAKLGPEHPQTVAAMSALANLYEAVGKSELAESLMGEAVQLQKLKLGVDHPDTLESMNNFAVIYEKAGRRDLALPLQEEVYRRSVAKLGAEHPDTAVARKNLADLYLRAGKPDSAVSLGEEGLRQTKAKAGADDPRTRDAAERLAEAYLGAAAQHAWFGRQREFADTCGRAVALANDYDDPVVADRVAKACVLAPVETPYQLGSGLALARKAAEAGPKHPFFAFFQVTLGMAEYRSGNYAQADAILARLVQSLGNRAPKLLAMADTYRAMCLCREGRSGDARTLLAEAEAAAPSPTITPRDDTVPFHDDLILRMASREAAAMLGPGREPPTAPSTAAAVPRGAVRAAGD